MLELTLTPTRQRARRSSVASAPPCTRGVSILSAFSALPSRLHTPTCVFPISHLRVQPGVFLHSSKSVQIIVSSCTHARHTTEQHAKQNCVRGCGIWAEFATFLSELTIGVSSATAACLGLSDSLARDDAFIGLGCVRGVYGCRLYCWHTSRWASSYARAPSSASWSVNSTPPSSSKSKSHSCCDRPVSPDILAVRRAETNNLALFTLESSDLPRRL